MIEGYRPGPVRVDPVGVAPAEVVAQALRCELLEAVAEAALEYRIATMARWDSQPTYLDVIRRTNEARRALDAALAALVAAGATEKAGT